MRRAVLSTRCAVALAGCGGEKKGETEREPLSKEAQAACTGSQETVGPRNVKEAHEEFEKELKGAGVAILFNELEEHDSEISWKGEGRTGQVAMREECGDADKTYVHITNRPA